MLLTVLIPTGGSLDIKPSNNASLPATVAGNGDNRDVGDDDDDDIVIESYSEARRGGHDSGIQFRRIQSTLPGSHGSDGNTAAAITAVQNGGDTGHNRDDVSNGGDVGGGAGCSNAVIGGGAGCSNAVIGVNGDNPDGGAQLEKGKRADSLRQNLLLL